MSEQGAGQLQRQHTKSGQQLSDIAERRLSAIASFDTQCLKPAGGPAFGPGRHLLGSRRGFLGHVVEKWQTAVIFSRQSGAPTSFSNNGGGTFNNVNTTSVQLGPNPEGSVQKVVNNVVYFTGLTQVTDPSVKNLPANLQSLSTLYAIQGADGRVLVQHPLPGSLGTLSPKATGASVHQTQPPVIEGCHVKHRAEHYATTAGGRRNLLNKPI